MTCHEFLSSIEDRVSGDLNAGSVAAFRAHAASCASCAARLAESEAVNRRLRGLREAYVPPEGLEERIRETIERVQGPVSHVQGRDGEEADVASGTAPEGRRTGDVGPGTHRWVRVWRWAPAAVASLLVIAVVALVLGPASVPSVIADTVAAYEELSSGARRLDVDARDPAAVREFFRARLNFWVPAPGTVGDGSFALKGGCACREAKTGMQIPCVVYDRAGTLLALMVVDRARLDDAALAGLAPRACRGRTVYETSLRGVSVVVCPAGNACHVWIARLPWNDLCEAVGATPEGRMALDGIRIAVEDMTCEMCCSGVREALGGVRGVKDVTIDMTRGEAAVLIEGAPVEAKTLVEALRAAGYRASAIRNEK